MSKLSKILIIVSGITIIAVTLTYWLLAKNKRQGPTVTTLTQQQQNMSFSINASQTNINVGNKIEVPIYLNGPSAQDVTAFDIKIDYDRTKLNLVNATQGAFFNKYLEVKWDMPQAWFSLARNPLENTSYPASPLLTLEFSATSKASSVTVSIDPSSSVYISNTGSVSPAGNRATFTIN